MPINKKARRLGRAERNPTFKKKQEQWNTDDTDDADFHGLKAKTLKAVTQINVDKKAISQIDA